MEIQKRRMRVGWLSRRTLLRSVICSGVATAFAYGCAEAEELEVVAADVPVRGLPAGLDGFTIGALSDFHAGAYLRPAQVERAVQAVNAYRPDLVTLLGDYVDGKTESHDLEDLEASRFLFAALKELRATYGVFAVLGNHDHWANGLWVRRELEKAGARVLANEHVMLDNGLALAGVDDHWVGNARVQRALAGIPSRTPVVLLSHNPDINGKIPAGSSVKAVLSGHTHGGQVRMPFTDKAFWVPCSRKYRNQSGLIRETSSRWTFISKGIGTYFAPVRWNCPPDVGILTLRRA
ncbi:MAG: metallophosphoesterase [Desulfobacteraceae bacterium]|nr:metallophosphoesterase [Desulfobacteraceae bacterium]